MRVREVSDKILISSNIQLTNWMDMQATRKHHDTNLECLFTKPLALLRQYVGPFALQTTYREMRQSMYYCAEVLQLPEGHRTWVSRPMIWREEHWGHRKIS